jgi:hypothetical protein
MIKAPRKICPTLAIGSTRHRADVRCEQAVVGWGAPLEVQTQLRDDHHHHALRTSDMLPVDLVRSARYDWLPLDEIDIPETARPYNATDVASLKNSIAAIGLQTPISVIERDGRYRLIAGRHRLQALRLLKAEKAPVRVVDMSDIEARLWAICENLHRTELTQVQRAAQVAEYMRLA